MGKFSTFVNKFLGSITHLLPSSGKLSISQGATIMPPSLVLLPCARILPFAELMLINAVASEVNLRKFGRIITGAFVVSPFSQSAKYSTL